MNKNKIIMAEYHPWDYRVQVGGHKYGKFFLDDGFEVLWLSNFLNLNRLIRNREDDRFYLKNWFRGWTTIAENHYAFTPFAFLPYVNFPFLESEMVGKRCLHYAFPPLTRTLRKHVFSCVDILWIGHPRLYSITDLVDFKVLIYRMSDDVGQFSQEPKTIDKIEATICQQADIVFATAQSLVEKARSNTDKVKYLPNGVDFDLFNAADLFAPDDLAKIPHPRILYVGAINDWVDFTLLDYLSDELFDYSFVLVGPVIGSTNVVEAMNQLQAKENIYILGSRPFIQVREYMRFSDVGLVPFIANDLTHSISPIKMFEYFASGLPVVARRLDEIEQARSPAFLYENKEECVHLIVRAADNKQQLSKESIAFGRANSWRKRYQVVKKCIDELL